MAHIQYLKGSIFDSDAQVIVNTVNCKGIMGKGLALAFKEKYPKMFLVYQQECRDDKLRIGRPTLYKESVPWILNFPTKDNWRANSKLEYLKKGLEYFVDNYKKVGIRSIAFPKLGAQNGKLSWDEVGPLMADYLGRLEIEVSIYIADGDREYQYGLESECGVKERSWKLFSKLALSQARLQQETQLNARDAKRVANSRASREFTSLLDIEGIEGLAKTSLKKIKDYINRQQYTEVELISMPLSSALHLEDDEQKNTSIPLKKRKRQRREKDTTETSLFTADLVG